MRCTIFVLLALLAELAASWWLWSRSPTDALRVVYSGFWSYEVGRLFCWIVLLPLCLAAWLAVRRAFSSWSRGNTGRMFNVLLIGLAGLLALALEISTSVWYWNTQSSAPVRDLYRSVWYWHRLPQPADQGWPSLKGYVGDHALTWCIVLIVAEGLLWLTLRMIARDHRGGIGCEIRNGASRRLRG